MNDCEYYLQLASGVEWVEAEAPKSSRTVTIGASTWRLNNCHGWSQIPNQVTMTFVDVKLQPSWIFIDLYTWSNTCKTCSNGMTTFYQSDNVLLLSFCPIGHNHKQFESLQDLLGEQLGNDLQNCCSQVSSSVPDCTACKQVWAKQLRTSSPFLCKYHFLHLTVSILQYQFQSDEGYPSWRQQRCSSAILYKTWLFSTCNL